MSSYTLEGCSKEESYYFSCATIINSNFITQLHPSLVLVPSDISDKSLCVKDGSDSAARGMQKLLYH